MSHRVERYTGSVTTSMSDNVKKSLISSRHVLEDGDEARSDRKKLLRLGSAISGGRHVDRPWSTI
jgi:hypothetical protein